MGLEGAVRLGFRRELDAIQDDEERQRAFETMVASVYEHGKGLNAASHFEFDDVIDPADSRRWITTALRRHRRRYRGPARNAPTSTLGDHREGQIE